MTLICTKFKEKGNVDVKIDESLSLSKFVSVLKSTVFDHKNALKYS